MAKHYIITNRPVRVKNGSEQIDESNQAATNFEMDGYSGMRFINPNPTAYALL